MTEAAPRNQLQARLFAAAGGDEQAWFEIVSEYTPRVFALLRTQCNDAELAEELTQSTFCSVAAKLGEYSELGKFEPWLFRIAMNRLRDEMRRRRRHAVSLDAEVLAGMAGSSREHGESAGERDEQLYALRIAMARLTEADRQVVQLRHYAGLSFKQIAEILDQPLGTVLARQHRALQKLGDMLGVGGDDAESARESAIDSEDSMQ